MRKSATTPASQDVLVALLFRVLLYLQYPPYRLRQKLLIWVCNVVLKVEIKKNNYRKQSRIATPLVASEMGRQTQHGLTWKLLKSEDFIRKVISVISLPSMQTSLPKMPYEDFTP